MHPRVLLTFTLLLSGTLAHLTKAQTEAAKEIPPPKFPITLRAPEKAIWTIKVDAKDLPPTTGPAPADTSDETATMTVTKTAPLYSETGTTKGGVNWEKWIFITPARTYRLIKRAGSPKWEPLHDDFASDISRYEQSDFEDFEWIDEESYKGVEAMDGRPVYVFEKVGKAPVTRRDHQYYDPGKVAGEAEQGVASSQVFHAKAWIDAETMLPLKMENGRETRTFVFSEPPVARLNPPAPVLAEVKKWIAAEKQMNR